MGACVSRPEGCVGGLKLKKQKKNKGEQEKGTEKREQKENAENGRQTRRRRRIIRRRVSSSKIERADFSGRTDRSFTNPTFQGSIDGAAWCDAFSALESEWDDEFYSVQDDGFSVAGSEIASVLSVSSPRDLSYNRENNAGAFDNLVRNSMASDHGNAVNVQPKNENSQSKPMDDDENSRSEGTSAAVGDEVSNQAGGGDNTKMEHNCGLIPNNCLPCLASAAPSVDKKRVLSPGTPSSKRRPSLKLSFKWREEQPTPTIISPKAILQRPIAGSSIPYCPIDKKVTQCWSPLEPSTFKVRGKNYFKDKKKDCAPNGAAFIPFGADIFLSQRKIHHIARFVQLPATSASEEVPSILVVNVQVPLYPATLFTSENDGEGMNLVMYFKLSENYSKELPEQFRENINRIINDEVERVRGFPVDTIAPFRERLKILSRLANVEDLQLTATEKKLIGTYNEKPVLTRPQHEFYLGENYFEIDLDMHRFSYFSRKGFETFQDRLKLCILDFGLTIQGNKAEDLPEHILCCMRLNEIDYSKFNQLGC